MRMKGRNNERRIRREENRKNDNLIKGSHFEDCIWTKGRDEKEIKRKR